jgi:hypothetical protein
VEEVKKMIDKNKSKRKHNGRKNTKKNSTKEKRNLGKNFKEKMKGSKPKEHKK